MDKSKVYFTNMRACPGNNLLQKLRKLIRTAGLDGMDLERKFTAIKIHFGEPGNLAFLRPNFAKVVVDAVKENGGLPFLTDCATLYVGRRKHALEHMDAAYENGFSPFSTGCHVVIADGLKGNDEAYVPVKGEYVQEARIGRAVMDADVVISLNHFKGHEGVGFGGALKNLGMGCGSRAGKMDMHSNGKAWVDKDLCVGCGICKTICAQDAIAIANKKATIDTEKCVGCGRCLSRCPQDAISAEGDAAHEILDRKIAEYALAVVQNRPNFHINIAMDISPFCDCHAENDVAILPDIGMFASFDPVALDIACADACNAQPIMPGSYLAEEMHAPEGDRFTGTHPTTNWRECVNHAAKIGLGNAEYELITVR